MATLSIESNYKLRKGKYVHVLDSVTYTEDYSFLSLPIKEMTKAERVFRLLLCGKWMSVDKLNRLIQEGWVINGKNDPRNGPKGTITAACRELRKGPWGCFQIENDRKRKRYRLKTKDGRAVPDQEFRKFFHESRFRELQKRDLEPHKLIIRIVKLERKLKKALK